MSVARSRRLTAALVINVVLVGGQVVAAAIAHSTSLLADAGHNATDAAAVLLSLAAVRWAMRPRSDARSFGNHRGTILAALANAAALGVITVAIVVYGAIRLAHPEHVTGGIVAGVGAAAMAANALAAAVLYERGRDLNMRSAFVHMAGDVAASFVVLVAGLVILAAGAGWDRVDPAASLVVALLILVEAIRIMKASADVLLESTPSDVDLADLRRRITSVPGVGEVHDLHVWSLSSDYRALSAHLVMSGHPTLEEAQQVGRRVRSEVAKPFEIAHTTFELECERCEDDEEDPCTIGDHHAGPLRSPTP